MNVMECCRFRLPIASTLSTRADSSNCPNSSEGLHRRPPLAKVFSRCRAIPDGDIDDALVELSFS